MIYSIMILNNVTISRPNSPELFHQVTIDIGIETQLVIVQL